MKKRRVLYLALILALILLSLWGLNRGGSTAIPDPIPQAEPVESESLQLLDPDPGVPVSTQSSADPTPADSAEPPVQETQDTEQPAQNTEDAQTLLDEDGWYYSKDEVALYIHQYGKLPGNFITKKEAEALGWTGGSLEPYASGKVLGGTYFGNYEGLLPTAPGREYTECDIDTKGKRSRGAKRIVFSNDGLIYYTDDHYESFELLYGEVDS